MSATSRRDPLSPGALEALGDLDLIARTIVQGFVHGAHRSPFLGSGEDFARHRSYQQGDDVRRLDWKLYGRTDRLYVRLFEEDSNLQAYVVVDTSASMEFVGEAETSKLRYGAFVAAALCHVMLGGGDAPGLASFGHDVAFHVPPRNRPGHLRDILLALERLEPGGAQSASEALDQVGRMLRRRGRVLLISDCLEEDDGEALLGAVGRLRARGDEVMVLRVASPLELGLTPGKAARYFDPERPARDVASTPGQDEGFRHRVEAYYEGLRKGLEEHGAEFIRLATHESPIASLGTWLRSRRASGS